MNKRIWTIIGLVLAAGLLFGGGIAYGQSRSNGWGWMNGSGMMGNRDSSYNNNDMMNGGMHGDDYGTMMGDSYSMMMGYGDMMGMAGETTSAEPLTIAAASDAVTRYIATLDEDSLTLGEVMIFDNHAYAQVLKNGSGAFEVLVDHATGNVYPEPGPNMMWNTEYSPMGGMDSMGMMGHGMMGSSMHGGTFEHMMDGFGSAPEAGEMLSAENAVTIAQRYLDSNLPNAIAEAPDAFPGYYTLHIEHDGEIDGMLSVNGYSGQVFVHHWHGDFIEMTGSDHD